MACEANSSDNALALLSSSTTCTSLFCRYGQVIATSVAAVGITTRVSTLLSMLSGEAMDTCPSSTRHRSQALRQTREPRTSSEKGGPDLGRRCHSPHLFHCYAHALPSGISPGCRACVPPLLSLPADFFVRSCCRCCSRSWLRFCTCCAPS